MTAGQGGENAARVAVDRLALALEGAGFDVGRDFPVLYDAVGRHGGSVVRIGDVMPKVADRLAAVLAGRSAGIEEGHDS